MCLKKYCCYPSSGWLKLGFLWNRESRPTVLLVKGLHMKIHPSPDCLVPTMPSRRNRLQADCEPPTEQDPICCKPSTFTKTMANVWTFYLTTSHTGNFAKCKPFEKVALIFLSLPLSRATKPTPPILFCYSRAHICHEYRESYWWRKSCHVEKFWDILRLCGKFWEIFTPFHV